MDNRIRHITLNGNFLSAEVPVLHTSNRSFCYGDALFETMHAYQDRVQFFSEHYQRLIRGMEVLSMKIPENFPEQFLHNQVISLMKKNRIYKGARIRLTVYRNEGGFYTPENNTVSYIIEVNPLETISYGFQQKGLRLGVFEKINKAINILAPLKSANSLIFVLAGVYKKENNLDECIILNDQGHVVETISSNIFFVRGNCISTPPLADGCVHGIMRNQIIRIAKELNYRIDDQSSISVDSIFSSDEVFLTNAVSGIQWVLGFGDRRFFHDVSASLLIRLNETAFSST